MEKPNSNMAIISIAFIISAICISVEQGNGFWHTCFNAILLGSMPFAFRYIFKHLRD